jgi:hypothetical protein
MTQVEDGLILKISSDASKQTERIVLAKNPIFKDEEEKKEGMDDVQEVQPKILQADDVQLYDFTKKVNLKEQGL